MQTLLHNTHTREDFRSRMKAVYIKSVSRVFYKRYMGKKRKGKAKDFFNVSSETLLELKLIIYLLETHFSLSVHVYAIRLLRYRKLSF